MISVSSLCKAPTSSQPCTGSDKAPMIRARLVMLLEPGTQIVAAGGFVRGRISRRSGRGCGRSVIGDAHEKQALCRCRWTGLAAVAGFKNLGDFGFRAVSAADVF